MRGADALIASLADLGLDRGQAAYLYLHSRRYELLLDGLRSRLDTTERDGRSPRILDVGPGLQTVLIRRILPEATVDSLGYSNPLAAPRPGEHHIDFDLNRAGEHSERPSLDPYDAIVFAEVLEHLATAPREVLDCLAGWLRRGSFLVIQTPNALALHKRVRALAGRDPLGAAGDLRAGSHSRAHFREYTGTELHQLAAASGLAVERTTLANHFRHRALARRTYDRLTAVLPAGTRQGITLYLRKPR